MIDYTRLPESLRDGAKTYIDRGVHPGGFLTAIIENNLREAFARADEGNLACMFQIVSWWYNEAPGLCWGSPERMKAWVAMRRDLERMKAWAAMRRDFVEDDDRDRLER